MAASRVVWSEHLLFLSSVLRVLRIVVFSEVANSTVSGKNMENTVCKISGVWIGSSTHTGNLCLDKKMEGAVSGEIHIHAAACDELAGEPRGEMGLLLLLDAHKPSPWSVLASREARVCASGLER